MRLRTATGRRRLAAIIGTSAVVAVGAAACGGGGTGAAPTAKTVRSAYTSTTATKTAKTSLSAKLAANGQNRTQQGKGVVNFGNDRMDLSFQAQAGSYETRLVGDTLYQHLKRQAQAPQSKKASKSPWLKVNLPKIAKHKGGTQFVAAQQRSNPVHLLSYLEGTSGSVKKAGTQTISGTDATHYRATVDLNALAGTPDHSKKLVSSLKKQVGGHTLPVDVWLDGNNRVVQQRMVFPLGQSASPSTGKKNKQTANLTVTTRFYDYGSAADITRPSGKVLDATPIVLKRLGSG
ncbi:MAG: hypothetical protein ACRDN9_01750 [Streptosporangiaceae bacterium]